MPHRPPAPTSTASYGRKCRAFLHLSRLFNVHSRVDTAGVAAVLGLAFAHLAAPPPPPAAVVSTTATASAAAGSGSASAASGGAGGGVGGGIGAGGVVGSRESALTARALAQPPDVKFRTPSTNTGEKLVFVQEAIAAFLVVPSPPNHLPPYYPLLPPLLPPYYPLSTPYYPLSYPSYYILSYHIPSYPTHPLLPPLLPLLPLLSHPPTPLLPHPPILLPPTFIPPLNHPSNHPSSFLNHTIPNFNFAITLLYPTLTLH